MKAQDMEPRLRVVAHGLLSVSLSLSCAALPGLPSIEASVLLVTTVAAWTWHSQSSKASLNEARMMIPQPFSMRPAIAVFVQPVLSWHCVLLVDRDLYSIKQTMDLARPQSCSCFKAQVDKSPALEGDLLTRFFVTSEGCVETPSIGKESTLRNAEGERCVLRLLAALRQVARMTRARNRARRVTNRDDRSNRPHCTVLSDEPPPVAMSRCVDRKRRTAGLSAMLTRDVRPLPSPCWSNCLPV